MIKRISITGPESTGKSELAESLASHYNTVFVPEYSREYLKEIGTNYSLDDVLHIAKGQLLSETEYLQLANQLLICDTDAIATKIWCLEVFKKCPGWIENKIIEDPYDLYLLCYPDLDWQPDELRENPENRDYLFGEFEKELQSHSFNFKIVKGKGSKRLKNAITFVDKLLLDE